MNVFWFMICKRIQCFEVKWLILYLNGFWLDLNKFITNLNVGIFSLFLYCFRIVIGIMEHLNKLYQLSVRYQHFQAIFIRCVPIPNFMHCAVIRNRSVCAKSKIHLISLNCIKCLIEINKGLGPGIGFQQTALLPLIPNPNKKPQCLSMYVIIIITLDFVNDMLFGCRFFFSYNGVKKLKKNFSVLTL